VRWRGSPSSSRASDRGLGSAARGRYTSRGWRRRCCSVAVARVRQADAARDKWWRRVSRRRTDRLDAGATPPLYVRARVLVAAARVWAGAGMYPAGRDVPDDRRPAKHPRRIAQSRRARRANAIAGVGDARQLRAREGGLFTYVFPRARSASPGLPESGSVSLADPAEPAGGARVAAVPSRADGCDAHRFLQLLYGPGRGRPCRSTAANCTTGTMSASTDAVGIGAVIVRARGRRASAA